MIHRKRCYQTFGKLQFRADLTEMNWDSFRYDPNPNATLEHFLKIVEKLFYKQPTYKKIKHPKSLFETKSWITPIFANSIKIKNKLCKSFCKEKYQYKKENYERHFKTYRDLLSALLRETKDSYYKQYFTENQLITNAKKISNHLISFLQVLLKK